MILVRHSKTFLERFIFGTKYIPIVTENEAFRSSQETAMVAPFGGLGYI